MNNKPQIIRTVEDFILPLRLLIDMEVPFFTKFIPIAIFFIYLIIPSEIVLNFVPIIGAIDDLAIITICAYLLVRLTPPAILAKYQSAPPSSTSDSADSSPTKKIIDIPASETKRSPKK
jgi:uncharacterized membrane protein YkvA (DUF1232 family)